MQVNSINHSIRNKMDLWLASITDKDIRKDVKDSLLISGGCITSLFLDEKVNDYDVYIQDINVLKRLAEYYVGLHDNPLAEITVLDGREKDKCIEHYGIDLEHQSYLASCIRNIKPDQIKLMFSTEYSGHKVEYGEGLEPEKDSYKPLYYSSNAITLSDKIQIILRFSGTPEEIHKNFDFIHATNYFTYKKGLVTNTKALESILTKRLVYQGSLYPITSIIRAKKFIKRGFDINAGELLKIMYQISKIDFHNFDILEDQLIGVDVVYFGSVVQYLKDMENKAKQKGEDFKLDSETFNYVIDKVFANFDEGLKI